MHDTHPTILKFTMNIMYSGMLPLYKKKLAWLQKEVSFTEKSFVWEEDMPKCFTNQTEYSKHYTFALNHALAGG